MCVCVCVCVRVCVCVWLKLHGRNSLQEAINVACKESIGHARRVNGDWFDKNDATLTRLIDEKQAALIAFRADPNSNRKKIAYYKATAEVQSHSRRAKNIWMQDRAREIQAVSYTHLTLPTNREV